MIEIMVDEESKKLVLELYERGCVFCGELTNTVEYESKTVCKSCAENLFGKINNNIIED